MTNNRCTETAKGKAEKYLYAAERSLLTGDGLSTLPRDLESSYYSVFTEADIFDHADNQEGFSLSLCFMAAMVEAGDAP